MNIIYAHAALHGGMYRTLLRRGRRKELDFYD